MFTIRKAQMEKFEEAARKSFENRMVSHLREFFPDECADLGEAKTRETIHYGITRAALYGITTEQDVSRWLTLMFGYGRDFDVDEKLAWAREVLHDPALDDPSTKMDCLYEAGLEQARQAADAAVPDEG